LQEKCLEYSKRKSECFIDTDNNRIFTISDLAKDIMDRSNGGSNVSQIIDSIKEKYQLPYGEAESKCRNFINGLIEKNIVF